MVLVIMVILLMMMHINVMVILLMIMHINVIVMLVISLMMMHTSM